MRNLTNNEISNVSGAGIFSALGSMIGANIGSDMNNLSQKISGKEPQNSYVTGALNIGYGIGEFIDNLNNNSKWSDALNNVTTGVGQIIKSAVHNLFNNLGI